MNFTAPDGRILDAYATVNGRGPVFGGNAYHCSDARILRAYMLAKKKVIKNLHVTCIMIPFSKLSALCRI